MKYGQRKPSFMLILTGGLLALLPVLAVLQYRWMGQVSEGERERLQKNLQESANHFTEDFDRELARIVINFQAIEREPDKLAEGYRKAYERWSQETAFPQLIKTIYVVEADAGSANPLLKKFNPTTGQLEPSQWSDDLQTLKDRFTSQYRHYPLPPGADNRFAGLPKATGVPGDIVQILKNEINPVEETIPALIIHRMPAGIGKEMAVLPFTFFGYAIITLDLDYIRTQVIPQLAARYFSGSNGLDYRLTVVQRRDPQALVYQSDNGNSTPDIAADSTADFFAVRLNEMNAVVREKANQTDEAAPNGRIAIQVFRSESVHTAPTAPTTTTTNSGYVKVESKELVKGGWQLLLHHRAGSLDAVVASARRRNLAVSFGILMLMALAVVMILLSTRRAARLAQQQMEFVAGVSHELRTPLAVIRSAGENLADGVIDEGAQVKRYGQLIASEGRRLTEMVEQILEFSGIQSGRKTYELRPVELRKVIENAITACRHVSAEGGFEIHQQIADDLPVVAADEAALSRALQNLLTNAMKYSGDNRRIEIAATPHPTDKPAEVRITVSDHGLGIADDELPHIFEPFYRGREATAAQIHGNGLGLSLVKNIVEAHHGKISVTSTEGKGSAFTIHLQSLASDVGCPASDAEFEELPTHRQSVEMPAQSFDAAFTARPAGLDTTNARRRTPDFRL